VIKTVVSIEMDVAASRAIRFASQLNYFIPMEIHPVYVKAPPSRDLSIGSGWARRHWEEDLVQQGKTEIIEMISSEWEFSPTLREPLVVSGDREAELLRIMEAERFDIFVDGERFDWTPADLHRKLHSRLWQRFPGIIGFARVLRKINKLLLLCTEASGVWPLVESMTRLWSGSTLPVMLAVPRGAPDDLTREAARAHEALNQTGCQASLPDGLRILSGAPGFPGFLREYGLAASGLKRDLKKDHPGLAWLSQAKVPLLIKLY
jgi:hypothetical protein